AVRGDVAPLGAAFRWGSEHAEYRRPGARRDAGWVWPAESAAAGGDRAAGGQVRLDSGLAAASAGAVRAGKRAASVEPGDQHGGTRTGSGDFRCDVGND